MHKWENNIKVDVEETVKMWTEVVSALGSGPVFGFCEYSNEL
jgi:hypothetical protein